MPTIVGQMVEKLQHVNGQVGPYPHFPDPDKIRPSVVVVAADRGSVIAANRPEAGSREPGRRRWKSGKRDVIATCRKPTSRLVAR
jgi:hypothetical protein